MTRQIIQQAKNQPAQAILIIVAVVSMLISFVTLTPFYGPAEVMRFGLQASAGNAWINAGLVSLLGGYTLWSVHNEKGKHMARSAFLMHLIWLLSALSRIVVITNPGQLLWAPFMLVAIIMAVIYIDLKRNIKVGVLE